MPLSIESLIGRKFGKLTVLSLGEKHRSRGTMWICKCDCGNETSAPASEMKTGRRKSCGCLHGPKPLSQRTKNRGMRRAYIVWLLMIDRCTNSQNPSYHRYGGRGISVCGRWMEFANFYRNMWPKPTPKHTLDRKDNNGNYEPANCRWADCKTQSRNRQTNRIIKINGQADCLTGWCESMSISRGTVNNRVRRGWNIEDAILTPVIKATN